MREVLLGLGSNKSFNNEEPVQLLYSACLKLNKIITGLTASSVYITKAMYVTNQSDFYNMVVKGFIEDDISPEKLLDEIHLIESELGRDRSKEFRFGPRSMDIDIELFGDEIINTSELQIPHIRLRERAFVLIPALEILKDSADVKTRDLFNIYLSKLSEKDKKEIRLFSKPVI